MIYGSLELDLMKIYMIVLRRTDMDLFLSFNVTRVLFGKNTYK